MLDGLWKIEISDTRGMSAAGLVLFHNGIVLRGDDSINIAGSYEEQGNAILATLEVLLAGPSPGNGRGYERVYLHVQGQLGAHTLSASGVDLSDVWRRADIRLERRALVEPYRADARAPVAETPAVGEPSPGVAENQEAAAITLAVARGSRAGSIDAASPLPPVPHEVQDWAHDQSIAAAPMPRPDAPSRCGRSPVLVAADPRVGKARV